jgi:hypothetical protein
VVCSVEGIRDLLKKAAGAAGTVLVLLADGASDKGWVYSSCSVSSGPQQHLTSNM